MQGCALRIYRISPLQLRKLSEPARKLNFPGKKAAILPWQLPP
jgi:hypothetical protein